MNVFADYISVIPVFFYFYFFYQGIITKNYFKALFLFISLQIVCLSTEGIKYLIHLNPFLKKYKILYRPVGAKNTDYLSKNGLRDKFTPGFPSGHLAQTSFFCFYMLLNKLKNYKNIKDFIKKDFLFIIVNLSMIFLMGFSRYYKNVHNIFQIIFGTLIGFLGALIVIYLEKRK